MVQKKPAKSNKLDEDFCKSKIFVSKSFLINTDEPNKLSKVELVFADLDTSKESYEARIFMNNSKADHNTEMNEKNGYIDSLFVFGHGSGCYGGPGHCKVREPQGKYDLRASDLKKCDHYLDITESIKKIINKKNNKFTITVVPILGKITEATDRVNVLQFDGLSISIKAR